MANVFGSRTRKLDDDTAKTQNYSYDEGGRITSMRAIKGGVHFPVKYHPLTAQQITKLEARLRPSPEPGP